MKKTDFEIVSLCDFSGIAKKVSKAFNKDLLLPNIKSFADGETLVKFNSDINLSGKKVFIVESIYDPIHYNLLNFLLLVHAVKSEGVKEVHVVFPYLSYMRQDKDGGMELVANMIEASGVTSVSVVDVHSDKIKSFFSVPFYNIDASNLVAKSIREQFEELQSVSVVSPDCGGRDRAKMVSDLLGCELITVTKKRNGNVYPDVVCVDGDCSKKDLVIVDDIIDTAGTAESVSKALKECGANKIYGVFTHSVFSKNGFDKIKKSEFEKILVSNTIPLSNEDREFVGVFDITDRIVENIKNME